MMSQFYIVSRSPFCHHLYKTKCYYTAGVAMKNTAAVFACFKKNSFCSVSLHAQSVNENVGCFSLDCDEAKNLAGVQPVFLRPVQVAAA